MCLFDVFKNTSNSRFEPLPKRTRTLTKEDFFYSLKLYKKNFWLRKYSSQLDDTISCLLNKPDEKTLFRKLVDSFEYVDRDESDNHVELIANRIKNEWKCDMNDTIIMGVKKESNPHPDGSSHFVYMLMRHLEKWRTDRFFEYFNESNKYIPLVNNVILCDDFIGSGGTINLRIEVLKSTMRSDAKLYVVAHGITENAIRDYLDKQGVSFYSPVIVRRAISHDESSSDCITMKSIETKLYPKYKHYKLSDFSLGYKHTGALYYNEDYRVPNNVYPIFWWGILSNGREFNSIFLRP